MTTTPASSVNAPTQSLAQRPAKVSTDHAGTDGSSITPAAPPARTAAAGTGARSSVKISAAAVAALQEARETPAQTAAEARQGDRAAKNIVARQHAHAAQYETNSR